MSEDAQPSPLKLPMSYYVAMTEHANESLPNECWGLIAGVTQLDGSQLAAGLFIMQNAAPNPTRAYAADPAEAERIGEEISSRGWHVLALYHSHPTTDATPSEADIDALEEFDNTQPNDLPRPLGIILSLADPEEPRFFAYTVRWGEGGAHGRLQAFEVELDTLSVSEIGGLPS